MSENSSAQTAAETIDQRTLSPDDRAIFDMLERTLAYARERNYVGWDYGDGSHSRILETLPVDSKWLNIAFQELAKRSPINIRPLLLVEQRRNQKGTALFVMANQTMATIRESETASVNAPVDYSEEARSLADWLIENRIRGYSGFCCGYPHPIQHLDGHGDAYEPDIVDTSFGVKALLRAAEFDSDYPEVVRSAADFAIEDLDYRPAGSGPGAVIDYHTKHDEEYYTINAGALCARMFIDLYERFGDEVFRERASGLLDYVAHLQTDIGGWMYREPETASHLSMDNHHNGFVIESFQRYRSVTGEDRYDSTLETSLQFYRDRLFDRDGAPNFDEKSPYPRDIHASTQGVLVFTYAGDLDFARKILEWTFEQFHVGNGRFYFRRNELLVKRVTLMRWCQAWMSFAMSEYLDARLSGGGR